MDERNGSTYGWGKSNSWLKHPTAVLLLTGFGSFMTAQDSAATMLIIPLVRQDFATGVAAVQWIALAYLLTVSGLLLPFGRLGDFVGLRRLHLTGIFLFGLFSVLCALAPTVGYLVSFRVLEAAGAAMKIATSPALLTQSYPAEQRGRVLGLQLTMTYLGLTLGPFLGGFVAGWWSWRGVFWINGLVSVVLLYFGFRILPAAKDRPAWQFDVQGAVFLIMAVLLLMVGVTAAGDWGAISSQRGMVRGAVATAGLFMAWVFLLREKRLEEARLQPLLSLQIFTSRVFSLSAAVALIGYTCEFFIIFLMPFYLLQVIDLSPSQAGLLFMARSIVMIVVAPCSGRMSDRMGARLLSIASMLIYVGVFLLQSRLAEIAGVAELTLIFLLSGVAAGLFVSPNNSAMIGAAPADMRGMASAVIGLVRNFGMVFGTAFSGALLAFRPDSLLAGFHFAMEIGALIALGGLVVGALQASQGAR